LQGANHNSSDKSESDSDLLGREIVGLISLLKISNASHKSTFSEYDFKGVVAE